WGGLPKSVQQRMQATVSATYFLRLAGTHALKLGADFELNQDRNLHGYTGGAIYVNDGTSTSFYRQFANKGGDVTKDTDPAVVLPNGFTPTTRTINTGLYLRDSYNVGFIP